MRSKILILTLSLLFFGCQVRSNFNPAINDIDTQITKISSHIQKISNKDHVYDNNNINLNLMYESKQNIKNSLKQITIDYQNGQIPAADYQITLQKSLSTLHFIWLEEFDAAYKNNNQDAMEKTRLEYNEFINQTDIQQYYLAHKKTDTVNNLQNTINEVISFTNQLKRINENKIKLSSLKQNMDKLSADNQLSAYNQLVDEYNALLEENNILVNEYNQKIELYTPERIYQDFLNLINISDIFPQQSNLNFNKQ